jgi:hypothetical protein
MSFVVQAFAFGLGLPLLSCGCCFLSMLLLFVDAVAFCRCYCFLWMLLLFVDAVAFAVGSAFALSAVTCPL